MKKSSSILGLLYLPFKPIIPRHNALLELRQTGAMSPVLVVELGEPGGG